MLVDMSPAASVGPGRYMAVGEFECYSKLVREGQPVDLVGLWNTGPADSTLVKSCRLIIGELFSHMLGSLCNSNLFSIFCSPFFVVDKLAVL